MYYTIATLTENCTENPLKLSIDVHGNEYIVWLFNENGRTKKYFKDLKDAYKVFEKLSSWIIFGYYSEKDRRQFLETGTMD